MGKSFCHVTILGELENTVVAVRKVLNLRITA